MAVGPMHVGNARELDAVGLAPGSVRCIITSPPYWDLKRYSAEDEREVGRGQTKNEYLETMRDVFKDLLALARPDGVMWLVADTLRDRSERQAGLAELTPLPFELADMARQAGWRLQDIAIWQKNKTLPYSGQGKLRNLIEYVLFFTRSGEFLHRPYRCATRHQPGAEWLAGWPERYHPLGKRPGNVWQFDIENQGMWDHAEGRHSCPFPQDLVARFLDLTTDKGDIVFDPFAGIGTVVAQSVAMGRDGRGIELNPANVETFDQHVLPQFQARWEADAESRRLRREDQMDEAQTILRLRVLKTGKEMLRSIQRLATARSASHPANLIDSVVAIEDPDLLRAIDIDAGSFGKPVATLLLVGELNQADRATVLHEVRDWLVSPPFSTFGLRLELDIVSGSDLAERPDCDALYEFGQSRHGAYTAELDSRLFPARPPLLTNMRLDPPVDGSRITELEHARKRGEKQLLLAELNAGYTMKQMARRVGVPTADLRTLLIEHGLVEEPKAFAVALPNQLTLPSD